MKKRTIFFTFSALSLSSNLHADIAKQLNWVPSTQSVNHSCSICNGHYKEPKNIRDYPNPPPLKTTQINIRAKGPVIFRENGDSVLQKDVTITQPGREVRADKAIVSRNPRTGKILTIRLIGNVRAIEHGKLLIGKSAEFNISKNTFSVNDTLYHLAGSHTIVSVKTPYDAWGTAKSIHHEKGVMILSDATYTTCPPVNPTWVLSAGTMKLDRNKNKGYAKQVVLRIHHIPIFYTPYFSYSLGGSRKSGFLLPSMGYATDHGFYTSIPYYWNMAPNYDWLLTPTLYSQRGVQFNSLLRFLTQDSNGEFYASFIPDDRKFNSFKQDTLNSFAGNTLSDNVVPYVNELRSMSTDRAFFDFTDHINFNENFDSDIVLRYVTDPYFARDFSSEYLSNNTNQLPSFIDFNYHNDHWQNSLLLQAYQTLHTLDHITTPAQNQYKRLPEFDTTGDYPNIFHAMGLHLNGQFVHFDYHSAFSPLTNERPIGDRVHLQPMLNYPITWAGGYVTPALTLDSTNYFSSMPSASATAVRPKFDVNRTLPILDVDSELYFDRNFSFRNNDYIQTFEPRLYYLYTPYLNQDAYPNFDTQLLPFSFSDLFTRNRFTGYDRIQNANQLSLGLTSDILSAADARNLLSTQFGFITYFSNPRVCLLPNCQIENESISPITGSLTFYPSQRLSVTSSIAWDTALHQVNNGEVQSQYHLDNRHIVTLGYQFTHGNADTPFDSLGFSTNSSLLTAGLVWPITNRWSFFGYTYYNLTRSHPEEEYVGLSYESCCWALRTIIQNNYDNTVTVDGGHTFQNKYTTNYFVEFLLKGLGSAGNHSAQNLLTSTLPGFEDSFSRKSHYGYSQTI